MTSLPPTQPLTRRERRLLEEQATAQVSVAPASQPLPVISPPSQTPPAPAPAPLTRRERRLIEQTHALPPADPLVTPTAAVTAPTPTPTPVTAPAPLPPVFATPTPPAPTDPVAVVAPASGPVPTNPLETAPSPVATTSRVVGDVTTATSSLILPVTPQVDMTSPLSSTGEVVSTGQIILPSRFAEQGSAPLLETSPDEDEVLDAYVTGEFAATAKPVRASQAVSGKGDDTDIVLVRRARWGTAAIVTVIVAGVLAVAAVGLLVLAMTTDVLG